MRKLLTLLFAFVLTLSLTMPVFAQEASAGQEPAPKAAKKEKKEKKKHHVGLHRKKKEKKQKTGQASQP